MDLDVHCNRAQAERMKKTKESTNVDTGFDAPCDAEFRGESVNFRIRRTLRELLVGQCGWDSSAADEHISDYLNGVRAGENIDRLIDKYNLRSARVLEVGSGLGNTLCMLLKRGVDAVGIEPGREWAAIISARLSEQELSSDRINVGIGEKLPFESGSFDFVLSQQVLEHVNDPNLVVSEMARVLRSGGKVYLTVPNYFSFSENHYRIFWLPGMPARLGAMYIKARGRDPNFYRHHINNITYWKMNRILLDNGFRNYALDELFDSWKRPKIAESPRNAVKSVLSILGKTPCEMIFHTKRLFMDEVTYVYERC